MLLLAIKSSLSAGPQTALRVSHIIEKFLSKVPVYICFSPPQKKKKTRRKLQSRFLKQEMELAFFFFFANDGSSVCVKESERQRERGSTLISSIMTHGGASVCESHIKAGAVSAEGYAYISLVLPVQQERAQKLMTGRRRCCDRGWSARTGETKQSKHADAESKQLQEKTCKSITLSRSGSCFCCVAGRGGCFPPARASGGDYAPN